jgi:hypothetical protein
MIAGRRLARSAMHCRLNRSTRHFLLEVKMECGDGSGFRRRLTTAETTSCGIAATLAAPKKPAIHIQHITLSVSGPVGRNDDPNIPRTSTINKPTPQNSATVFRMSEPGGIEGIVFGIEEIVFEEIFAVACMAGPFV